MKPALINKGLRLDKQMAENIKEASGGKSVIPEEFHNKYSLKSFAFHNGNLVGIQLSWNSPFGEIRSFDGRNISADLTINPKIHLKDPEIRNLANKIISAISSISPEAGRSLQNILRSGNSASISLSGSLDGGLASFNARHGGETSKRDRSFTERAVIRENVRKNYTEDSDHYVYKRRKDFVMGENLDLGNITLNRMRNAVIRLSNAISAFNSVGLSDVASDLMKQELPKLVKDFKEVENIYHKLSSPEKRAGLVAGVAIQLLNNFMSYRFGTSLEQSGSINSIHSFNFKAGLGLSVGGGGSGGGGSPSGGRFPSAVSALLPGGGGGGISPMSLLTKLSPIKAELGGGYDYQKRYQSGLKSEKEIQAEIDKLKSDIYMQASKLVHKHGNNFDNVIKGMLGYTINRLTEMDKSFEKAIEDFRDMRYSGAKDQIKENARLFDTMSSHSSQNQPISSLGKGPISTIN